MSNYTNENLIIATAKTGERAIKIGDKIFVGLDSGSSNSTNFYKCSSVSRSYTEKYYVISGAGTTEINGDYYDSGNSHDGYPIYIKDEFAIFYSNDYGAWFLTNDLETAILQDAFAFSLYQSMQQSIIGYWDVTNGDGSAPTIILSSIIHNSEKTWSGYKAIQNTATGIYNFEITETSGLIYESGIIPQVGGIYNSNATIAVTLYQGDSLNISGLAFYAPLNTLAQYAMTGLLLSGAADTYTTIRGIQCARFSSLAAKLVASDSMLPHGNSSVTFSCWLNFQTIPNGFSGLLTYGNNKSFGQSIAFPDWSSVLFSGAFGENALTTTTPSQGVWYHFLSMYDSVAGVITNYVNGVQSGLPYSINLDIGVGDIKIADSGVLRDLCLAGIRIYNRALTPSEITLLATEFTQTA